ncbi:MAG TPA: hypothetical protein VMR86_00600 [Myxococcota bacterium]|nr:hypothetical protein [Myxococcota bacterium]
MRALALAFLLAPWLGGEARAATVTDPTGDFLSSYSGPQGADLDVVSTNATLHGSDLVLNATLAGPIGTTPGAFYVWGVDRGAGASTASFASLSLPNIVFDSVVIVQPDGSGQVVLLGGASPVMTPLASGSVLISGNSFAATVPLSMLPSNGLSAQSYTQNLWPRYLGVTSDDQISDFAPDATMAPVTAPEPVALALVGLSGLCLLARARRPSEGRPRR